MLDLTQKEFLYIGHGSNPGRIHEFTQEVFIAVVASYIAKGIGFDTAIGKIWPEDVTGLIAKLQKATDEDIRGLIARLADDITPSA